MLKLLNCALSDSVCSRTSSYLFTDKKKHKHLYKCMTKIKFKSLWRCPYYNIGDARSHETDLFDIEMVVIATGSFNFVTPDWRIKTSKKLWIDWKTFLLTDYRDLVTKLVWNKLIMIGVTLKRPFHSKFYIPSKPCDKVMLSWLMSTHHLKNYYFVNHSSQCFSLWFIGKSSYSRADNFSTVLRNFQTWNIPSTDCFNLLKQSLIWFEVWIMVGNLSCDNKCMTSP